MDEADSNRGACDSLGTLLADRRRRLLWAHLNASSEDVFTLEELAGQLAEREREPGVDPVSDDRRQRVAVDLHHRHLPALADVGVLEYDARSRTVRYRKSTMGDDADVLVERILAADASRLPARDR